MLNSKLKTLNSKFGLYIHIPFCLQKCPYCDFSSFSGMTHLADDYIDAVLKEYKYYKDNFNTEFSTLFIGGGTPTCLSEKQLERLFSGIYKLNPKERFSEISIEVNPETVNEDKMKVLADNITRISMGAQSFDDNNLKRLGRIHNSKKIIEAADMIRNAGVSNINIDIMYGIPGQSVASAVNDISEAVKAGSSHISYYMLTLYEGTSFPEASKNFIMPDEPLIENMYVRGTEYLRSEGFEHYEISNFAKEKRYCQHNLVYWSSGEYVGLGSSAASHFDNSRYINVKEPKEYIKLINEGKDPAFETEKCTVENNIKEEIMLSFRTKWGIDAKHFKEKYGFDFVQKYSNIIEKYRESGMMEITDDAIFLTEKGFLLSNTIISEFF